MEKRRRARINDSLNQLKTLILPLIGKDVSSLPLPRKPLPWNVHGRERERESERVQRVFLQPHCQG